MRSVWNGSISFGLVSIPIKLYSGSEDRRIELDMLDKHDKSWIRYKRVNEKTGKEVQCEDIVKGYLIDDEYIVLEDDDFDMADMKKSKTIDIQEFVLEDEVAEVLFKKPYFIEPRKDGEKSYALLLKALKESKKLGVATFVMRQKEHLCLIGVYQDALVLHIIRFADEIRDPSKLEIPDTNVSKKELDMAHALIEQYTSEFNFNDYKDVYNEKLLKIIRDKAKGKKPKLQKIDTTPTEATLSNIFIFREPYLKATTEQEK